MTGTQIVILLSALGTLGTMIGALQDWHAALTPGFVGGAVANVALQVAGLLSKGPEPVVYRVKVEDGKEPEAQGG